MASHQVSMEASGGHLRQVASSRGLARLSELNAHAMVERRAQTSEHRERSVTVSSVGMLRREVRSGEASGRPHSQGHAASAAASALDYERHLKKHQQGRGTVPPLTKEQAAEKHAKYLRDRK